MPINDAIMFLKKLQNDRILDIGCGQFYEIERFNALCYIT